MTIPNTCLDYFDQQAPNPRTEFEEMIFALWHRAYEDVTDRINGYARSENVKVGELRAVIAAIGAGTVSACTDWFSDNGSAGMTLLGVQAAMRDAEKVIAARGIRERFPDMAEGWLDAMFGPNATTETHVKAQGEIAEAMNKRMVGLMRQMLTGEVDGKEGGR